MMIIMVESKEWVKRMEKDLKKNKEAMVALSLMEDSDGNVFITGKAGTGKSTLLRYFRSVTKKNIAVIAPTGVAAVNVEGQTLHSFFGFKPDITVKKVKKLYHENATLYRKLDAIVIDEISMVRADIIDCIDAFLRLNGREKGKLFGGIQMIFIGDLYQLPPVVGRDSEEAFRSGFYPSPWFFDAKCFTKRMVRTIELTKVYRQEDEGFIGLLDRIRTGTFTDADFLRINDRVIEPDFSESEAGDSENGIVYLTATRNIAERINRVKLMRLEEKPLRYRGNVEENFPDNMLPTHLDLILKKGAQVMLLRNDPEKRYSNGDIGRIVELAGSGAEGMIVNLDGSGEDVEVYPHTWDNIRFSYDSKEDRISSETVGHFVQYPLSLAWAFTIHKGQGKTFDRVAIDFGGGAFAPGQAYVAFSRCRTLEGIQLSRPIGSRDIFADARIRELFSEERRISSGDIDGTFLIGGATKDQLFA
jgi:ATP-dependent exoDNAse (exonuclease V) alpha subunit